LNSTRASDLWPVELTGAKEGGCLARLPDLDALTQGESEAEALGMAADLLEEWVLGAMAHSRDVPLPSPADGRPTVALPALAAGKLEVYRAMRAAGLGKKQLAERIGWTPAEVTRLFDGRNGTGIDKLAMALAALGRRLVISSEAA
jgi:antitoxin HicB